MSVAFKEIGPNHNIPEKWKEIVLNTGNISYKLFNTNLNREIIWGHHFSGGTHSTLQDIKLPQKAGGYWYKDSKKANTRNRFIYWYVTYLIVVDEVNNYKS